MALYNHLSCIRTYFSDKLLEGNEAAKPYLDSLITIARRGQHVLTRREILKYVTAEGSTRAEQIQELLNITEIEDVRKSLVKVQNNLERDFHAAERNLQSARVSVGVNVHTPAFEPNIVLEIVNQNRAIMGAVPIQTIDSTQLKTGVKLPTISSDEQPINVTLLEFDIENLKKVLSEQVQSNLSVQDEELRSIISLIHSDPFFA